MAKAKETPANDEPANGTGLAEIKNSNGALAEAPSFMGADDFAGAQGFEGADREAYSIPFLQVLQKMSPLVDEDNPSYVQGAKAGMLYNTVTRELYDGKKGLHIIPCAYKRSFIQWGGREGDGGFKGEFTPEEYAKLVDDGTITLFEGRGYIAKADGSVDVKKCDYFADTRSHYVITLDEDGGQSIAVISLSSTQTKASRVLMTLLQGVKVATPAGKRTPPTFANKVLFTTVTQSNDKGSWSGAKFELAGLLTDADLFNEAKQFHQSVTGGKVAADHSKADNEATGNDPGEVGASGAADEF
jgi:hypothetical protein